MPRNAQGIYSLPAGNPVVPGTLIESTWANPTMADIAAALTGSLPRNGSAGMQGPLILAGNASVPLEAVPLQQLNAIVGGSNTYLPAGAIQLFAMSAVPSGWLECNGAAISRTTYANLFAAIGTLYGAGNGTTTFNLPDLRGMFVRGWDNGRSVDPGRTLGSQQAAANNPHTHTPTVVNPAHTHTLTDPGHNHTLTDPGHVHTFSVGVVAGPEAGGTAETHVNTVPTNSAMTGITLAAATTGISSAAASQATTVSIASEGIEARPVNIAMVYAIKAFGALQTDGLGSMAFQNKEAVNITGGSGVFTTLQCTTAPTQPNDVARLADIGGSLSAVLSADPQVLLVDNTTPATPILRPQTNTPNGMVKLDAAGFVPSSVLNITDLTFLGNWNASVGALPVGTFATGDYYVIDVAGTLTLNTSGGNVAVACNIGDQIVYNAATPGWWYYPAVVPTSLAATAITFVPEGTIVATDVQAAIAELDGETQTALAGKAAAGASFTKAESNTNFLQVSGANKLLAPLTFSDNSQQASAAYSKAESNGPAFRAIATAQQVVNANVADLCTFNSETFDTDNCYNSAQSKFVPNVAGYYQFNAAAQNFVTGSQFGIYLTLRKNGVAVSPGGKVSSGTNSFAAATVSDLIYLNGTTDYVDCIVTGLATSGTMNVQGNYFSGFLARHP